MFPCPECGDTLLYNYDLDIYICDLCGNTKTRQEICDEGLDLPSAKEKIENKFLI